MSGIVLAAGMAAGVSRPVFFSIGDPSGHRRHPRATLVRRNGDSQNTYSEASMSIRNVIQASLFCAVFALPALQAVAADQWHFKVKNGTQTRITKLQVSENKKEWGDFDVGRGIAPGKTETMEWDSSTDSEGCDQWIRAAFSDGSFSEPSKQNFCEDLDTPIEFTE
jgi:hypothetical protein